MRRGGEKESWLKDSGQACLRGRHVDQCEEWDKSRAGNSWRYLVIGEIIRTPVA